MFYKNSWRCLSFVFCFSSLLLFLYVLSSPSYYCFALGGRGSWGYIRNWDSGLLRRGTSAFLSFFVCPPLHPMAKKSCVSHLVFLLFPMALFCITLMAARGICSALSVIVVLLSCRFSSLAFLYSVWGCLSSRVGAGLWLGWA